MLFDVSVFALEGQVRKWFVREKLLEGSPLARYEETAFYISTSRLQYEVNTVFKF